MAHILNLQHSLLIILVDVENARDKIRDLARMINIDHVHPHLFGEQGIIFGNFLHFTNQGPGQRFHLEGVRVFIVKVINNADHGGLLVHDLSHTEPLDG